MRVVAAFIVSLFLLMLVGCGTRPGVERAERSGCAVVRAGTTMSGNSVVLAVSARECRSVDGVLLSMDESLDRLVAVVWAQRWPRFEAVHATVHRSAEEPGGLRGKGKILDRSAMEQRWGPRPVGLEQAETSHSLGGLLPLLLMPVAAVVCLTLMLTLIRTLRAGAIVVVWFHR